MDKRIENLVSGNSYTLYDFFGQNRIIVIPDLQRDYCWAETIVNRDDKPSLVQCYLEDLIYAAKQPDMELKMGLLYGYEYPLNSVQLCDGQQRLTTLFLICGVCYDILKNAQSPLIRQAESILSSCGTSRLQYAVRDSTLSFLNNLVNDMAFHADLDKEDWFSGEYAKDPSVRNIVRALNQITSRLNDAKTAEVLLIFILHKISFLYFDMLSREYSEEQYVILNTTGRLLTPTEHIKPKLLGMLAADEVLLHKYSEKWESWEQFIWEHRLHDENFTVDEWFDRLLKIFYLSEYASLGSDAKNETKDYTTYQQILRGSIKYDFPQDDKTSVLSTLDMIDQYFNIAKFLNQYDVPLSLGLSMDDGRIPSNNIWEYLSNEKWNVLGNLQQSVTVFNVLNRAVQQKLDTNLLRPLCERLLDFAWVQAQYKSENQDVAKFLAFVNSLDIKGESIYKVAQRNDMFSTGLRDLKFKLLENVNNSNEIGDLEFAIRKIAHLNTSKGKITYVFNALDEVTSESVNQLWHNLIKTTENISPMLRRALLSYGPYYISNGSCNWGARYDFAYSTNFFYDQLHKSEAKRKDVIETFIKDIANKEDVEAYLLNRVNTLAPVPSNDTRLDEIIRLLYSHEEYFEHMGCGRIAIDDNHAYAMTSQTATGENYLTIVDPRQRMLLNKTKETLGDSWTIWDQFTIAKSRESEAKDSLKIWVTGDWWISSEDTTEFCSYISVQCNDEDWSKVRSILLNNFPDASYVDDKNKYFHFEILKSSSYEEAAILLSSIYDRLSGCEIPTI